MKKRKNTLRKLSDAENPFHIENRERFESLVARKASSLEFAMNGYIELTNEEEKDKQS